MSDQKQPISGDEAITKAKEYAKDNPDSARSAIDKVEDFLDARTGGRFSGAIDKGGDMVEQQLGLPSNQGGTVPADPSTPPADPSTPPADPGSVPTTPPSPLPPSEPTPSEVPVPSPAPGTSDDPQPRRDPAEPGSTIPGDGQAQLPETGFPAPDAGSQPPGSASPGEGGGLPQGGGTQQGDPGAASQPGGTQPADGGDQLDLGQDDTTAR